MKCCFSNRPNVKTMTAAAIGGVSFRKSKNFQTILKWQKHNRERERSNNKNSTFVPANFPSLSLSLSHSHIESSLSLSSQIFRFQIDFFLKILSQIRRQCFDGILIVPLDGPCFPLLLFSFFLYHSLIQTYNPSLSLTRSQAVSFLP